MSVSFSCPDAPVEKVPCQWCDDPEYACGDECTGFEEVSSLPQLNWSNVSARGVLELLGIQEGQELGGALDPSEIPGVLQRILYCLNSSRSRSHLIQPLREEPKFVDFGNQDYQTVRRLRQLQELLSLAASEGYRVTWG